jgi:hypothetical protein
MARVIKEERSRPFDLSKGPLLRTALTRTGEEEHILMVTMHHVVSDGWSQGLLIRELAALYEAFDHGRPSPLKPLPIQYADYAVWQREWLTGDALEQQLEYWRRQLASAPQLLELPTDRPRPAVQTFRGARRSLELGVDLSERLNQLSQTEGVTLFMTLLAGFYTLLHRYTGQDNIVIGSPIATRRQVETEELIGCFVNTLALHADLSDNPRFQTLLKRVREITLGAHLYQDLPFDILVDELQPQRTTNITPLFQVWFVLFNTPQHTYDMGGLKMDYVDGNVETAQFDLVMSLNETELGITSALTYNTDLFDASTIIEMLNRYKSLLEEVAEDPNVRLLDLKLSSSPHEVNINLAQVSYGAVSVEDQFVM